MLLVYYYIDLKDSCFMYVKRLKSKWLLSTEVIRSCVGNGHTVGKAYESDKLP